MAVKLTVFLAKLATEPREYIRFMKDPEGFMKKAGLAKAHQEVVKSGNRKKMEAALRKEQKGVAGLAADYTGLTICITIIPPKKKK